jgi:hypothetical protein
MCHIFSFQPDDMSAGSSYILEVTKFNHSPYAKRPEGSRELDLVFAQTFGAVRNIR